MNGSGCRDRFQMLNFIFLKNTAMGSLSRRKFIRSGTGILGLAWAGLPFGRWPRDVDGPGVSALRLSYSTLGCPDWSFDDILNFAVQYGYRAIELRGILTKLEAFDCPQFSDGPAIEATRKKMEEKGLSFIDLCSSTELHVADSGLRRTGLDAARRYIDLAQQLNCPFVRVFPNHLPKDQGREATLDLIVKGLLELGDHAKGGSVSVLMETHGDLVDTATLKQVMQSAKHPHTGLIWDFYNMWSVTGEPPEHVYAELKDYIRHTHIKDGMKVDGKERLTLLGQGQAPVFETIQALVKGGYEGFYSFEWEKRWNPGIEAPELAIGAYPKAMEAIFKRVGV
jgi:sugar phosphate isomerase/epimerase